jgi:hypothetical protein
METVLVLMQLTGIVIQLGLYVSLAKLKGGINERLEGFEIFVTNCVNAFLTVFRKSKGQ